LEIHIQIAKHWEQDGIFEKIIIPPVFAALGQNAQDNQIGQKCAPGRQAPKTAPDGASGADFHVGFRWAPKINFFMLLSSITRP